MKSKSSSFSCPIIVLPSFPGAIAGNNFFCIPWGFRMSHPRIRLSSTWIILREGSMHFIKLYPGTVPMLLPDFITLGLSVIISLYRQRNRSLCSWKDSSVTTRLIQWGGGNAGLSIWASKALVPPQCETQIVSRSWHHESPPFHATSLPSGLSH